MAILATNALPNIVPWHLVFRLSSSTTAVPVLVHFPSRIPVKEEQPQWGESGAYSPAVLAWWGSWFPGPWGMGRQWAGFLGESTLREPLSFAPSLEASAGMGMFWIVWLQSGCHLWVRHSQSHLPSKTFPWSRVRCVLDLQIANPKWSYEIYPPPRGVMKVDLEVCD